MVFHFENASNAFRLYHARGILIRSIAITGHFGFVVEENPGREISGLSQSLPFQKLCFQYVLRAQGNEKPTFSNSSGLKRVSERLCFRDGLVWTVGLTVERKLCFQISRAWCGWGMREFLLCYVCSLIPCIVYYCQAQLRPVSMLFPDYLPVVEVWLVCCGFTEAKPLAMKIKTFVKLINEQVKTMSCLIELAVY